MVAFKDGSDASWARGEEPFVSTGPLQPLTGFTSGGQPIDLSSSAGAGGQTGGMIVNDSGMAGNGGVPLPRPDPRYAPLPYVPGSDGGPDNSNMGGARIPNPVNAIPGLGGLIDSLPGSAAGKAGGVTIWDKIGDYFGRGVVVILGFIFVTIGLSMLIKRTNDPTRPIVDGVRGGIEGARRARAGG